MADHKQNTTPYMDSENKADLANLPIVQLLGVRIHTISLECLITFLTKAILRHDKMLLAYVNVDAMNIAYSVARFRNYLNQADIIFCDGFGIKLGARLLGIDIPYRYTPPDWLSSLSYVCAQQGFSVFLLGALPGVAEKAAANLQEQCPTLRIAGVYHGYFDKTLGSSETAMVIERINAACPHVLIVGFGMPMQEYWLEENWAKIQANVALPVGAALDYVAGKTYRGPKWMTDNGFEWLARLLIEPKRLWKRYILGNPLFLYHVFLQRLRIFPFD